MDKQQLRELTELTQEQRFELLRGTVAMAKLKGIKEVRVETPLLGELLEAADERDKAVEDANLGVKSWIHERVVEGMKAEKKRAEAAEAHRDRLAKALRDVVASANAELVTDAITHSGTCGRSATSQPKH